MISNIIVAIDGPAGAGKSVVAKAIAKRLGYTLVDTGAIYRAVALLAQKKGVAFDDDTALGDIVASMDLTFDLVDEVNHVFLSGNDVSDAIRTPEISMGASAVSARPVVRAGLLQMQRTLAGHGRAVLEGRDIGTVVCPQAQVKVFLSASQQERAMRRFKELRAKEGATPSFDEVLALIIQRDTQDSERDIAPLRAANDAQVIDSTQLTIEEVVTKIITMVECATE